MSPTTPSPGADHGFQASQGFGAAASLDRMALMLTLS